MSCTHDCDKPPVFPRRIHNRPALSKIDYRIGTYADMRLHMLDLLNKAGDLNAWTHRGPDDPGIALLESAAMAGDILTYYQNLYANEAFLRTATWRESIAELVQLLGYRLAPGIGGEAYFALAVKGPTSVTVPEGFGFKAQLQGLKQPAEFESTKELIAHPHLGRFNLCRPRLSPLSVNKDAGINKLELQTVDGKNDAASLASLEIGEGDRLMLVPDATLFDQNNADHTQTQKKPEILIVSKVETRLDRVAITFEGSLQVDRNVPVTAYVIGRTFRHFGHSAPIMTTLFDDTQKAVIRFDTRFDRQIGYTYSIFLIYYALEAPLYSYLKKTEMPLDQEVDNLAAGVKVICQGALRHKDGSDTVPFTVVRTISEVRNDSLTWGPANGASTVITLDDHLIVNNKIENAASDIRSIQFHEVISPELTLSTPSRWPSGDFTNGQLKYYGTLKEVKALAGKDLLLVHEDGRVEQARVNSKAGEFSATAKDEENPWMWSVTLAQPPGFKLEDFDEEKPKVTVYGNVVKATQGKSENEVVLGNGDQRQMFQTFALPKTPLTYLLDSTQTPAQVPELHIYVNGILWKKVNTFFNSGPSDHVYIVREDDEGKSWVQFGDGKTGARLPSGNRNVVAKYRTGNEATGRLKAGSNPQATGKLNELDKVFMPGPVVGGGPPETQDNARSAAPGKMQSLGRLVGLSDFEAEALALPGVLKARAAWTAPVGVPLVRLTVLTKSGGDESVDKVRDTMHKYNRCRGPARFPVDVIPGKRQHVYIEMRAGYEVSRRQKDIAAAIKKAVGMAGEEGNGIDGKQGLFGLDNRQFGMGVHISQIVGAAQQVTGVTWVEIDAAQLIDQTGLTVTDPTELSTPPSPAVDPILDCDTDRVLALHTAHFVLNLEMDQRQEECKS